MQLKDLRAVQKDLAGFVDYFKSEFGRSERRHWCGMYLSGLMLDGERKSIEPMAERLDGGDVQALSQFVNQSPWAFEPVQEKLRRFLFERLKPQKGFLILDDTTFPKKGTHSVGVSHQYCGALGKQANCQSLVSWQYASAEMHFPLQAELYLPASWTSDLKRMKKAGVPERRWKFQEKWRLALELLDLFRADVPHEAILCDAGYGQSKEFLHALDERNEFFIASIPSTMSFWPAEIKTHAPAAKTGRPRQFQTVRDPRKKPLQAQKWAKRLHARPEVWKTIVLPHQQRKKIKVAAVRVREVDSNYLRRPGKERWLLIERFGDGFKYYLSNLSPETLLRDLAVAAHSRWKIEQGYQQLKEELGLDHFEGRTWQGFHHHVTLCFMAYDFLLMLKQKWAKKKFPFQPSQPSAVGSIA